MTTIKRYLRPALCLASLYIVYITAMLAFSSHTSPMWQDALGWDSAIFSLMGKGVCEGKTLYADLFDHKGPVIFYINAIGHLAGGRTGIFAVQCVFGAVCIFLFYKIFLLLREERGYGRLAYGALVFFAVYSYFFFTFERGNLTEEYSLVFITVPLYLMLRYAKSAGQNTEHPLKYSFVYGICFGILAFLRVNNAVTVVSGVLALIIFLLVKKRYACLLKNILAGIGGILSVSVPISLVFLSKGAFREMIYAAFIHNLKYNSHAEAGEIKPEMFWALFAPIILCGLLFLISVIKNKSFELCDGIILAALLSNTLMLCISNQYPHYFAVFVPVYFVALSRYFTAGLRPLCVFLITVAAITSVLTVHLYFSRMYESHFVKEETKTLCESVKAQAENIPPEERDSVICFQITPYVYHYADIMPAHKYFTLQNSWAKANPEILCEFFSWMEQTPPTWVVIAEWEDTERLFEILDRKYELQSRGGGVRFYRLKEQ